MDDNADERRPPHSDEDPNGMWSPFREDGSVNDDFTVEGRHLRLMWDEGAGPLWGDEGLLPAHPEWLRQALGLSDSLIADLLAWLHDMDAARDRRQPQALLDAEALRLTERLQGEVGSRFRARFRP